MQSIPQPVDGAGALNRIEADIQTPGRQIQVVRGTWPKQCNFVSLSDDHRLMLFLPPVDFVGRARFLDGPDGDYNTITPLFFQAAGVRVESLGTGGDTHHVRLSFTPEHFRELVGHEESWSWDKLEAALRLSGSSIEPLMLRLGREATAPGLASPLLIEALGTTIIIELARILDGIDRQARGKLTPEQLALIRDRAACIDQPAPTLAELALLCGVSERSLLRLFKHSTGESVAGFVRSIRADRARDLLGQTDLPLKEIAWRLGYASHASFTAAFRRDTGYTPAEFRRVRTVRLAASH